MDPSFVPVAANKALFDLKNGYVYKVAVDNIQESSLQVIVNESPVGDGQTTWKNIIFEAEKSMAACLPLRGSVHILPPQQSEMATGRARILHTLITCMSNIMISSCDSSRTLCWRHPIWTILNLLKRSTSARGQSLQALLIFMGIYKCLFQLHKITITWWYHSAHWHLSSYDTSSSEGGYDIDTPIDTIVANAHNMWITQYGNHVPLKLSQFHRPWTSKIFLPTCPRHNLVVPTDPGPRMVSCHPGGP
jgi:hypothetical protein